MTRHDIRQQNAERRLRHSVSARPEVTNGAKLFAAGVVAALLVVIFFAERF